MALGADARRVGIGRMDERTSGVTGQIYRNLQPVRGFYYVSRYRSFTKAADALGLDQSTVSVQIRRLERDLATVLFDRSGGRVALTPDGEILLELVTPLVEQVDRLGESFAQRRLSEIAASRLSVASGPTMLLYMLPPVIARFGREFPAVTLELVEAASNEAVHLIAAGRADIGIVYSVTDLPSDLTSTEWLTSNSVVIVKPGHPLTRRRSLAFEDLARFPFIFPDERHVYRRILEEEFRRRGLQPRVVMEAGAAEVIKCYVRLGFGIAVIPSVALSGEGDGVQALPADHLFPGRRYSIVTRRARTSQAARRFLELLKASQARPTTADRGFD